MIGISWIILIVAVLAIFIVSKFIHFRHIKHRITAIIIILLALFLYTSIAGVVNSHNIDLKTPSGVISAGRVYFLWLGQAFVNIKTITGDAIKMNWMPKNASISSISSEISKSNSKTSSSGLG
jgi:hypothetical protein